MEFQNRHARHPTWPPTTQLLTDNMMTKTPTTKVLHVLHDQHLPRIDEDPYSHFLSPILEDDNPMDDDDYDAGISSHDSPTSAQKTARFRARLEERWESFVARRLLSHQHASATGHAHAHALGAAGSLPLPMAMPSTPPEEDALPDLLIEDADALTPDLESSSPPLFPSMFLDDEADGWEADRLRLYADQEYETELIVPEVLRPVAKRPRFKSSRTLSGKKHAWREPSWDLWTVDEVDESAAEEEESRGRASGKAGKRSKNVHWAEEVQVVEYEW